MYFSHVVVLDDDAFVIVAVHAPGEAAAYHVSIAGEVFPERVPGSAALGDEVSHPVPDEVGFTRVGDVVPVRELLLVIRVSQAAGQPQGQHQERPGTGEQKVRSRIGRW